MTSKWEMVRLGDVISPVRRKISPSLDDEFMLVTLPLYGKGARLRKTVLGADLGTARFQVQTGDLMISKIDARKGSNSLLPEELDGAVVTGDFLSYEIDRNQVQIEFMDLVARSLWFSELCDSVSSGTTNRIRLDVARFRELRISLPPLIEQQRIVDLIGALDDAIEAAEDVAHTISFLKAEAIQELLGDCITQSKETLSTYFQVIDCEHKTAPATKEHPYAHSIGTAAIRNGDFVLEKAKPVSEATYDEWTKRAAPVPGDVVMSREAPVGEIALVTSETGKICLGQRTVLIRPIGNMTGELLWALLISKQYQELLLGQSIGLTVQRVNVKTIKNIPIPLLSADLAKAVSDISTASLAALKSATTHTDSLRKLRSELLTALLSGAHTIPDSYDDAMATSQELVTV